MTGGHSSHAARDDASRVCRGGRIVGTALALVILAAAPALAQDPTPIELQETRIHGMGARAMGMGQAYTALSEDVTALGYNPAGLAQIRKVELSGGLVHSETDWEVDHFASTRTQTPVTRLDHLAFAYPTPTYRGSLVFAFGFHRNAPLDTELFQEGFAFEEVSETSPGLLLVEDYYRHGAVDQWTGAIAGDVAPYLSIGGSVSYLSGSSREEFLLAQYRVETIDDITYVDVGLPGDPETWPFEYSSVTDASLHGWTGNFGLLFYLENGFRFGTNLKLPVWLHYEGYFYDRLEDKEKIDEIETSFRDDITLPMTLEAGLSWGRRGFLVSGGLRWTDYRQIDFEGPIRTSSDGLTFETDRAYRSVVAFNVGAEYALPSAPIRLRAGYFTEPLPYRLIPADPDFTFVPEDADPDTYEYSYFTRDYPEANVVSDRKNFTLGAGLIVENTVSLDFAYVHGRWERETPSGYRNSTDTYETVRTRENVKSDRFFLGATLHFN